MDKQILSIFDHLNSPRKLTPAELASMGFIGKVKGHKMDVVTEQQAKQQRDSRNAETDLQNKICSWLRNTYPDLVFLSYFAAGLKLSPFLANIRSLQSCNDKVPDLYIFGPCKPLIIEIKVSSDNMFLVDGVTLASEHLQRQFRTLRAHFLNFIPL